MLFEKERLPAIFSRKDFARGQEYYRRGQVRDLKLNQTKNGNELSCVVQGNESYNVYVRLEGEKLGVHCNCPRFAEKRICKHIAAAMIACAELGEEEIPVDSDRWAKNVLRAYMERSNRLAGPAQGQLARLVPRIFPSTQNEEYPSFSLQVGFDKLYVVRDIKEFVKNVIGRETVSYGKGLRLCHALEQFDQDSQALISLLTDQFALGRTSGRGTLYSSYYEVALFSGYQKNRITLTGSAFDRLFDLYLGKEMEAASKKLMYTFSARDPEAALSLTRQGQAAVLRLDMKGGKWTFFGNPQSLYAIGQDQVLRCSGEFREKVYPLLKTGWRRCGCP